ncbi:hypothetical protein N7520_009051 [Penicillium odoratum]|uniref:uncharacterized protein n=1 Tax=Penicillium odoratum TaxID=1167516 RepID=UPI0025499292|nr:uncharacterized protein N7520_009051 [Penicillium odoratum]KAJ5752134.1 hypothetical protein N7520_009051 [Penicillium odoratum]
MINFLGSYNNDVEQIERALGHLLQKDERIQSLSATVKELQHFKDEESRMAEEEQHRLVELQSQLNDEKISLENLRQNLDQRSKQLEEEKQQFKADVMAKYEKAIATEKKKLEDELQKRMKLNEKTTAAKFEQAKQKNQELQNQLSAQKVVIDDTESILDDTKRILALFKDRAKELEFQKEELESKYKTQDSPLSDFMEDLSKIHKALKAIAHAYFGDLPLDDIAIDQSQRLRNSNPVFEVVPLTGSATSKYLRVRAAQSVIAQAICHSLWQPFDRSTLSLAPDQIFAFVQISKALARQDRRKESLWRYLTFQGLDVASLESSTDTEAHKPLSVRETQRLSGVLGVLIPQPKRKEFERDLGNLLTECVRFWNKANRDSCLVEIDTNPPDLGGSGWLSEPCPDLDHVEGSTEQDRNRVQAWCLFPRVTFKDVNEKSDIFEGSAVFSDCPAFYEGSCEIGWQKEQLAQLMRQFTRQPPILKGR